jgi:tRNA-dependent cyclodipeptide synthase
MNLYQIRGGTKEELEQKQYTIGVGISLGNKWFTPENIFESIKWALNFSKGKVVIYVADSIHAINVVVRNRKSMTAAKKITSEAGEDLFNKIKQKVKELPTDQAERLVFVKWDEIVDENFTRKLEFLRSEYAKAGPFQETIHQIVREHVSREDRNFSDEDINRLGSYIIEELPECLNRVPMKGIVVDAYTYPQDNGIVKLIEQMQKGEIFPEIKANVLDTKPKVFLEVK